MASGNQAGQAGPPLKRLCASVSKKQSSKIDSYFRRPASASSVESVVMDVKPPSNLPTASSSSWTSSSSKGNVFTVT